MKWKWITIIILIFQLYLIFLLYNNYLDHNIEVCSVFWNEECSSFNIKEKICSCRDGEYLTTSEMIADRNELMREEMKGLNEEEKRQWAEEMNKSITFLGGSLIKE